MSSTATNNNNNNNSVPFNLAVLTRMYAEAIVQVKEATKNPVLSVLANVAVTQAAFAKDTATLRRLCSDSVKYPTVLDHLAKIGAIKLKQGATGDVFVTDAGERLMEMLLPARVRLFNQIPLPSSWGTPGGADPPSLTSPHDIVSLLHRFSGSHNRLRSVLAIDGFGAQTFPPGDSVVLRMQKNVKDATTRANSEQLFFTRAMRFSYIHRSCDSDHPLPVLLCCERFESTGTCDRKEDCFFAHRMTTATAAERENPQKTLQLVRPHDNHSDNDDGDDAPLDAAELDALAAEQEAQNSAAAAARGSSGQKSASGGDPLVDIVLLRILQYKLHGRANSEGWINNNPVVSSDFCKIRNGLKRDTKTTWKIFSTLLAKLLDSTVVGSTLFVRLTHSGEEHTRRVFHGHDMLQKRSDLPTLGEFLQQLDSLQRMSSSSRRGAPAPGSNKSIVSLPTAALAASSSSSSSSPVAQNGAAAAAAAAVTAPPSAPSFLSIIKKQPSAPHLPQQTQQVLADIVMLRILQYKLHGRANSEGWINCNPVVSGDYQHIRNELKMESSTWKLFSPALIEMHWLETKVLASTTTMYVRLTPRGEEHVHRVFEGHEVLKRQSSVPSLEEFLQQLGSLRRMSSSSSSSSAPAGVSDGAPSVLPVAPTLRAPGATAGNDEDNDDAFLLRGAIDAVLLRLLHHSVSEQQTQESSVVWVMLPTVAAAFLAFAVEMKKRGSVVPKWAVVAEAAKDEGLVEFMWRDADGTEMSSSQRKSTGKETAFIRLKRKGETCLKKIFPKEAHRVALPSVDRFVATAVAHVVTADAQRRSQQAAATTAATTVTAARDYFQDDDRVGADSLLPAASRAPAPAATQIAAVFVEPKPAQRSLADLMMLRLLQYKMFARGNSEGWIINATAGSEFQQMARAFASSASDQVKWKSVFPLLEQQRLLESRTTTCLFVRITQLGEQHVHRVFEGQLPSLSAMEEFWQQQSSLEWLSAFAANNTFSSASSVSTPAAVSAAVPRLSAQAATAVAIPAPPPPPAPAPAPARAAVVDITTPPRSTRDSQPVDVAAAYAVADELRRQLREEREQNDRQQVLDSQEKQEMSMIILQLRAQVDDLMLLVPSGRKDENAKDYRMFELEQENARLRAKLEQVRAVVLQ